MYLCVSSVYPPPFVIPRPAFCLSHTHTQSDSTDTHSHLPTLKDSHTCWNVALPPPCITTTTSVRACTPTHNYSGELEKPDVYLDSMWSKTEPPHSPQGFVILTGFSISYVQELREVERNLEKETGRAGSGTSSRKSLHHYCLIPYTALMPCNFYKGLFHLFSRHLLASCNMQCNVKDNSWHLIPTCRCFFHLMSERRTYTLYVCPTSAIKASLGRNKLEGERERESCTSQTFHFVILEFIVIDGRVSQSSLRVSSLETKCALQQRGNGSQAWF